MKKASKVLSVAASIVLWIIILIAALFAFTTLATRDVSRVSSIAGYTPLSVMTDSMKPAFVSGDLIIIKKTDPSSLEKGDIITFHTIIDNQYQLNTHRIADIIEDNGFRSYVTKGDNNAIEDQHIISDGDIVGKYVTRLPGVGKFMDFLKSSMGFLIVIVLPMLLFFIYQVYHLIMVSISLKKAMAVEAAEEASSTTKEALLKEAEGIASTEAETGNSDTSLETEKLRRELEEARKKAEEAERRLREMQNPLNSMDKSNH
ncbi:MAG: signal peptidase I [Clostridiales bacterium]|nr:signal peptidase I [Clostridiales bacterium]